MKTLFPSGVFYINWDIEEHTCYPHLHQTQDRTQEGMCKMCNSLRGECHCTLRLRIHRILEKTPFGLLKLSTLCAL
jgi:hypothetical protein